MKNKFSLLNIINGFAILLLIIFMSYVFIDFKIIFNSLKEIQKTKIVEYFKTKSSIISPLIKYGFNEIAKEELNNLDKSIKYIQIKTRNFLYKKGDKKNLKIINLPLKYKNQILGEIEIGYDDKELLKNFSNEYFRYVMMYLVLVLFLFFVLYIFLRKKISSLNLLAKKIEKINFKKTKSIEIIDDYFEIRNITNSINYLLFQINNYYNHQKKLIMKISLFKKQLETAQKIAEMFPWEYDCESNEFYTKNFYMKKKLGFDNFDEFLNSIIDKDKFINEIKKACKKNNEFELLLKLENKENQKFYFKVQGKVNLKYNKKYIIGIFINVTDEIKKQEQIEYLAYHDPLTGLINRTYLKEELDILIKFAKRNNKKLAVVFIDLDNFKYVNDSFGHDIGDLLLVEISNRLKKSVRKSDVISRIGGDEFVLVLNDIKNKEDVKIIMEKIKHQLQKPIYIKNHKLETTFSAGVSVFPDDAEYKEDLLKFADIAMYESKKGGKNKYCFIDDNLKKEINGYYLLVEELKSALEKDNELILYYQPKININTKKVIGVEALIRWQHPKKGLLTPYHFIDVAEKSNLINFMDDYVLEKGFKVLKKWENDKFLKELSIAINISANKFNKPDFVEQLRTLINKYNINPDKLQLEITETLSMQNVCRTIEILNKIKFLGIRIALDDFGTGYSSLNYLKKLPFDILKIDQSFVKDLLNDKDDLIITKMIVEISKILNKINVAEGVENKQILLILENLGISIIQGYYFSKPLSEKDLKEYIINFDYNNYI